MIEQTRRVLTQKENDRHKETLPQQQTGNTSCDRTQTCYHKGREGGGATPAAGTATRAAAAASSWRSPSAPRRPAVQVCRSRRKEMLFKGKNQRRRAENPHCHVSLRRFLRLPWMRRAPITRNARQAGSVHWIRCFFRSRPAPQTLHCSYL